MKAKTNLKIRVRLESFNHELLSSSCQRLKNLFQNSSLDSITTSLISLPSRKRIYCVLRSPHVNKDSREHFEIRVHKRLLEIYCNSETSVFDLLSNVNLPSGVFYQICLS